MQANSELYKDIVDAHVHIGKWNFLVQDTTTIDLARTEMKKAGIEKFIVMITSDDDNSEEANLRLLENCTSNNFFFYWIDPATDDVTKLRRLVPRVTGFKLHPSYTKTRIDDPKMTPFLELMEDTQKPLIVHCGRLGEFSSFTYPVDIAPKYTFPIVLAHMGGPPYHMKAHALKYIKSKNGPSNLYVDTSTCFQPFLIKKAIEYLGEDKVLFGSDYPLYHPIPSLQTVMAADINKECKHKILGKNFMQMIKL